MIVKNNFAKNEPVILKIFYWIGIICFIIHLFDFSIFNNELDKIFSIVGYVGMFLFFIRMYIFSRKNEIY